MDDNMPIGGQRFECRYARQCGGCNLTELGYYDQLAMKQAMKLSIRRKEQNQRTKKDRLR